MSKLSNPNPNPSTEESKVSAEEEEKVLRNNSRTRTSSLIESLQGSIKVVSVGSGVLRQLRAEDRSLSWRTSLYIHMVYHTV